MLEYPWLVLTMLNKIEMCYQYYLCNFFFPCALIKFTYIQESILIVFEIYHYLNIFTTKRGKERTVRGIIINFTSSQIL